MKKIYISGKITGDPQYKEKFDYVAAVIEAAGYAPVNPTEVHLEDAATWGDYMRHDIKLLCDCDGVYMLNDWQESKGAKIEHQLAQDLGMKIYYGTNK